MVVPVQGPGPVGIGLQDPDLPYDPVNNPLVPITTGGNTTADPTSAAASSGSLPDGVVNTFAEDSTPRGCKLAPDRSSIPSLSITFSADGTTFYAADDDGDLAVQDDGQPGRVDHRHPDRPERPADPGRALRRPEQRRGGRRHGRRRHLAAVPRPGRPGQEHLDRRTGQQGPRRLAGTAHGVQAVAAAGGAGGAEEPDHHRRTSLSNTFDGHGTPVAGVVAQFVPQATIEPVSIF